MKGEKKILKERKVRLCVIKSLIPDPPIIKISGDSNMKVAVGQVVKVICSVDSNPSANVTWWTKEPRNISQGKQ